VGVAGGRFAEHFLTAAAPAIRRYDMIEPFPQATLRAKTSEDPLLDRVVLKLERRRLGEPYAVYTGRPFSSSIPWHRRGIGLGVDKRFFRALSTDPEVLARIPLGSVDFVYLDGAHDYVNVKAEMEPYWARVAPGGVLAGHDYCHYPGDRTLACRGRRRIDILSLAARDRLRAPRARVEAAKPPLRAQAAGARPCRTAGSTHYRARAGASPKTSAALCGPCRSGSQRATRDSACATRSRTSRARRSRATV